MKQTITDGDRMRRLFDSLSLGQRLQMRAVPAKLGIADEPGERDIDRAETRTPAVLAKNPIGRIPTLDRAWF